MSVIVDAIQRISTVAKQKGFANMPGQLLPYYDPYPSEKNIIPSELAQEQIELVDKYLGGYQTRLTLEQINETVRQFRFKLSKEFYDLYQLGNGCLPLITSKEEDLDSIYNYFYFISYTSNFLTLKNAMNAYCSFLIDSNPSLLPICTYQEEIVLCVLGSNIQEETSPVIISYDHDLHRDPSSMEIIWPSLSNMLLAYAELYETSYDNKEAIYKKYGSNSEWGLKKFLRV